MRGISRIRISADGVVDLPLKHNPIHNRKIVKRKWIRNGTQYPTTEQHQRICDIRPFLHIDNILLYFRFLQRELLDIVSYRCFFISLYLLFLP